MQKQPSCIDGKPVHDLKGTVWCGFTAFFIIGLFFFDEISGDRLQAASITGDKHTAILKDKVIPHLNGTFVQDEHLPNSENIFGDIRVLSRSFQHEWPPRSPRLTTCDFSLWCYLESVYKDRPTSLVHLIDAINYQKSMVPLGLLFTSVQTALYRLTTVLISDGRHIQKL